MDARNFVNSQPVYFTNSEQEAIHIPGFIQTHGILLVLQEPQLKILQASKNTEQFFGIPASSLINQDLTTLFRQFQIDILAYCLDQENIEIFNPIQFSLECQQKSWLFECAMHRSDGVLIFELEPAGYPYLRSDLLFYHLFKSSYYQIKKAENFGELTEMIVKEIRKITGFDRVMLYQFQSDESGVVVAEDQRKNLESFLGLHYPASDIPRQARELYHQNLLQLIVDLNYEPVEIIPAKNPLTKKPLDLSCSVLRSFSPCHVQYLKNMGVSASMSIGLMNEKKLWGLIACHHYSPKYINYEIRKTCELLGQLIPIELGKHQRKSEDKSENLIELIQEKLSLSVPQEKSFISRFYGINSTTLLELVNAEGVALCFGDDLNIAGKTPSQKAVKNLIFWLENHRRKDIFSTDSLSQLYPEAKQIKDRASGVLAISIFLNHHSYHVVWFRPEVLQTVNWGGNPNQSTSVESDRSLLLSPRQSFELWKETVREKSLPWKAFEIEAALKLRDALMLAALEFSQSALQQALKAAEKANRELRRLATLDGLTQLANRRWFDEYLSLEWRRMAREKRSLSLILCDVDFFKSYNDEYGHQAGDACLKQVAQAMSPVLKRPADLVARYGGEEFVAILPNTKAEGAVQVAEAIRGEVRQLKIAHVSSNVSQYVTVSLGVSSIVPTQEFSSESLIVAADEALYEAKRQGRDRVVMKTVGI